LFLAKRRVETSRFMLGKTAHIGQPVLQGDGVLAQLLTEEQVFLKP